MTNARPFGLLAALAYAIRAAAAHFRFARANPDSEPSVVVVRKPSHDRMDDIGSRWSEVARIRGAQPNDPRVMWADVADLFSAYHSRGRLLSGHPDEEAFRREIVELLEAAWGVIANAGESNWERESHEWQEAAERWRDRYHGILKTITGRAAA